MRLVEATNPVLWKPAAPVTDILEQVLPVVSDMRSVMRNADGLGLAAPQVGIPLRFFVWEHGTIINPVILGYHGSTLSKPEGCLSFPHRKTFVARRDEVEVEWTNMRGERQKARFRGMTARIFQHETDHLDGKCIFAMPAGVILTDTPAPEEPKPATDNPPPTEPPVIEA